MSLSKRSYVPPILGLIVALTCSQALAGFETESFSVTTPGIGGLSKTNLSSTLALPKFNSMNGMYILSTITLTSSDFAQMSASLTNNSASTETFTVTDAVNFNFSFMGTTILSDDGNVKETETTTLAKGSTGKFGVYNPTGSSGTTLIDPNSLAEFSGTGNLDFLFNASASVGTGGGGGNLFINPLTMAGSTLTVTYGFTVKPSITPEPSSVVMTGLGGLLAAGVGYFRSRARAKALSAA
jgi:hypothetical protein